MKTLIDSQIFSEYIKQNHLFEKTKENLILCLKNFYRLHFSVD